MLFGETVAVYYENHMEHAETFLKATGVAYGFQSSPIHPQHTFCKGYGIESLLGHRSVKLLGRNRAVTVR
jgi:hypothetical protein